MDHLQSVEVDLLVSSQHYFKDHEELMLLSSDVGNPAFAFVVYFPAAFLISEVVGLKVLWAAVVTEWLNIVLKWLMMGQRPYWWIHETNFYDGEEKPYIEQFRLTCETGPGCPSGHSMVTTAVWWIMIKSSSDHCVKSNSSLGRVVSLFLWILFSFVVLSVGFGRIFIACHFPHQVILGTVVGILLGILIDRQDILSFGLWRYIGTAIFIVSSVSALVTTMTYLHLDPSWSINLAKKWCANSDWIHIKTTPFYTMARDIGAILFCGIALHVKPKTVEGSKISFLTLAITLLVTLYSTNAIEHKHFHFENHIILYSLGVFKNGMIVVVVMVLQFVMSFSARKLKRS